MDSSLKAIGNYRLQQKLNYGARADIFLATDANQRSVVIRRLRDYKWYEFDKKKQFLWGAQVLQNLDHPNIVKCYETGKFEGAPYYVMEYATGRNLKDMILSKNPVLADSFKKIALSMASALQYLHDSGYIHNDYKPENIVVSGAGETKLLDFDLVARQKKHPLKVKAVAGTPHYIAPEILLGQPYDERADIFSFGVVIYEMVTSRKPVLTTSNNTQEVIRLYQDFDKNFRRPREICPDLPTPLEQLLLNCLVKSPEGRYPGMQLAVRDLMRLK